MQTHLENSDATGTCAPFTILVHGFTRSRYDMLLLSKRLSKLLPETSVHVYGYASRKRTIEEAATDLSTFVEDISKGRPVSFVGHSLGGLIVRALDAHHSHAAPLHRLVTLGTPHQGSSAARLLSRSPLLRKMGGPVLSQLATPQLPALPRHLEVGCIIGATNSPVGFLPLLRGDNDGLVFVDEAIFPACKAEERAAIFHGLFPFSSRAAQLAAAFLRCGTFDTSVLS